jgi:hypothetical protein
MVTECAIGSSRYAGILEIKYPATLKEKPMNSHSFAFALVVLAATAVHAQSLGEQARELRKDNPPQTSDTVITNDDLRQSPSAPEPDVSEVEKKTESAPDASEPAEKAADGKPKEGKEAKPEEDLATKIAKEKDKIAQTERDLDALQHDKQVKASNNYGDASARLRDPKRFADEERKNQEDIAAKQKELEESKSKLDEMTDESSKSGDSTTDHQ